MARPKLCFHKEFLVFLAWQYLWLGKVSGSPWSCSRMFQPLSSPLEIWWDCKKQRSWRWWTLSFRGIGRLWLPLFSDSVSHIFDRLVRRRRNPSLLPKAELWQEVWPSCQGCYPTTTGPGQVKVVRQTAATGRHTMPKGNTAVSSVCFQNFWIWNAKFERVCSNPSCKYWQWIQHFIKLRQHLCSPFSPSPPLSCPSLLPSSFCWGGGVFEIWQLRIPEYPGLLPFAGLWVNLPSLSFLV